MKTTEITRITKAEVLEIVGLKGGTITESAMPTTSAWFLIRCEGFRIYKNKSYPSEYEKDMLYNGSRLLDSYKASFVTSGFSIPDRRERKLLDKAIAIFLEKAALNT